MSNSAFANLRGRACIAAALLLPLLPPLSAGAAIPVRHVEGTMRGFLTLRNPEGRLLAIGDFIQTVSGDRVTDHIVYHYKDGSLDDETTIFTQRRVFQLVSDHHIQKGPFFPHPIDMTFDGRTNQVTVHSPDKSGKDQVNTQHLAAPPDVVNTTLSMAVRNLASGAAGTSVTLLVAAAKPRIVTLIITPHGEDPMTMAGVERKALHYGMRFDIGGVAGKIAPWVGKQPPDAQMWIIGGEAPTFIRSQSILFEDGPVLTVEQVVPAWPGSPETPK